MKVLKISLFLLLGSLALAALSSSPALAATTTTTSLASFGIITQQGLTDGLPTNLATQDQSGTFNTTTPAAYVRLGTPKSSYIGIFQFMVPTAIPLTGIQSIQVLENFAGPTSANQHWTWEVYNWKTAKWVLLGDNASADGTHWLSLSYTLSSTPSVYVKTGTGEFRIRITSSNLNYDGYLDYLRIKVVAQTATPPPSIPLPTGQAGNWNLVFDDEFSGSKLDLKKWRPNWQGTNDTSITVPINSGEASCYNPSQVSVSGGLLKLTAIKKSCMGYAYTSGVVESNHKFNFTYGAMEARVNVTQSSGEILGWPAFWAVGGNNWPKDGEIDVFEGIGGDPCFYFHYSGGKPGGCVAPVTGWASGWHTYGANWQKGRLDIYIDGVLVWTNTTGITSLPMFLVANMGIDKNHLPTTLPLTMQVDYIRVWQTAP